MEGFLRIGLLIVAAVIVSLMFFESRSRRRMNASQQIQPGESEDFTYDSVVEPQPVVRSHREPSAADLLIMSVVAKPGTTFASYDLFQAISAVGLQYGDMKIFHYTMPTPTGKCTLFSLASTTKPGHFDLDNMGDFSCAGLTLFMDMFNVPDPVYAFDLMHSTAQQLADDLDGELRAGQKNPWTREVAEQYREKALTLNDVVA